ncbi:MAG: 16S rRNA (uracil(1498)-N(3))-methyltransferase [Thermomicrobium sp.]|nr:16S rRNA (uracil(1498)-N(3))-methyltransferase [Thermomicrobium sp.]
MSRLGHRFFVPFALELGSEVELPESIARQATRVLRLRPGDSIVLFDGRDLDFLAELQHVTHNAVRVSIRDAQPSRPLPPPPITLLQALLRHDHFELVVEKATELGVVRIVPLRTQRSIVHLDTRSTEHRLQRWYRIAVEASEQCGRGVLPIIDPPCDLVSALERLRSQRLVALWEAHTAPPIAQDHFSAVEPLALAIGPEGGWTSDEIELLSRSGADLRSLGPLILRSETAAIAGIAAVRARTVVDPPAPITCAAPDAPRASAGG